MDLQTVGRELAKAAGMGLASGFTTMLAITILAIPVSFVMNRMIYHNALMRLCMGAAVFTGSLFSFIGVLVMRVAGYWGKSHYFGMFPVMTAGTEAEPSGWFASVIKLYRILVHPLMDYRTEPDDQSGYAAAVETLLVPTGELPEAKQIGEFSVKRGVVPEEFFAAAREVARITQGPQWRNRSAQLSEAGSALFD